MWRADGRAGRPAGRARRLRRRPGRPGDQLPQRAVPDPHHAGRGRRRRAIPPTCSPRPSTGTRRRRCSAPTTKDPIVVRNVVGSHEEVHTFNVSGHRWLSEPDNPKSAPADTQTLSLAEFANYEFSGNGLVSLGPDAEGDARLGHERLRQRHPEPHPRRRQPAGRLPVRLAPRSTASGSACGGIFRVPSGRVADLQPLPDKAAPLTTASPWPALKPGAAVAPPPATGEAATCPATAPARDVRHHGDDEEDRLQRRRPATTTRTGCSTPSTRTSRPSRRGRRTPSRCSSGPTRATASRSR